MLNIPVTVTDNRGRLVEKRKLSGSTPIIARDLIEGNRQRCRRVLPELVSTSPRWGTFLLSTAQASDPTVRLPGPVDTRTPKHQEHKING
jgi:hypothetical protein